MGLTDNCKVEDYARTVVIFMLGFMLMTFFKKMLDGTIVITSSS